MANFVGIDLGTTFSAVAYIDATGRPTIVKNEDGESITPSCVRRTGAASVDVGEEARRALGFGDAEQVAARFKRDLGKSPPYHRNYHGFTPTEASALVLKKLKEFTEQQIGQIDEAVVTVPANFDNEAREQTMAAAKSAGLRVSHVINEPTAAAMFYGFDRGSDFGGTYAVYDLGGGTFDVSIVRVQDKDVKVLTSQGVQQLGGDDFDQAILTVVQNKYRDLTGEELSVEDFSVNDAEEAKKSLSRRTKTLIVKNRQRIEITRAEFEAAISSLLVQTRMLCRACLRELKIEASDITGVLLVGGSTRVPAVVELVTSVFGQPPIPVKSSNQDEAVALGAALYAAYKADQGNLNAIQRKAMAQLNLTEAARTNLGTICLGINEATEQIEEQNNVMIEKNATLPVSITETFFTTHAGQASIRCTVTESAQKDTPLDFVKILKAVTLDLPPNLPNEEEISITFEWREDNIVKASFHHPNSGRVAKIDLTMSSETAEGGHDIEDFLVE